MEYKKNGYDCKDLTMHFNVAKNLKYTSNGL